MICKLRGDGLVDRATIFCDRSRARTSLPEDSVQGSRMIFPLAFADIPDIFHSLRGQKHLRPGIHDRYPFVTDAHLSQAGFSDTRFLKSSANSILMGGNDGSHS